MERRGDALVRFERKKVEKIEAELKEKEAEVKQKEEELSEL